MADTPAPLPTDLLPTDLLPTDLLPTDLLGTWTLAREIEDRYAGQRRTVLGEATLSRQSEDHVRWRESGVMTWAGGRTEVGRTLDVVRRADDWWVLFSDGREFHPWSVTDRLDHPCGRDHYRGRITADGDAWTVAWHCTGPEKDYSMLTRHSGRR